MASASRQGKRFSGQPVWQEGRLKIVIGRKRRHSHQNGACNRQNRHEPPPDVIISVGRTAGPAATKKKKPTSPPALIQAVATASQSEARQAPDARQPRCPLPPASREKELAMHRKRVSSP